jgi:trigger factor
MMSLPMLRCVWMLSSGLSRMIADVRRGLAVAAVVEAATVTDTDGNVVDTSEFFGPPAGPDSASDGPPAQSDDQPADPDE